VTGALPNAPQAYRGERLGLPATGQGAIAKTNPRIWAFIVDALAASLVAGLFVSARGAPGTTSHLPGLWSWIPFVLDYVVGLLVAGRSLGMYLLKIRVIRVDQDAAIGPGRAIVRTVLLSLLIPALVWDRDGRGMHDRFTDTAVVQG
jgi:uncharacterized RDD family membrane protein YckC